MIRLIERICTGCEKLTTHRDLGPSTYRPGWHVLHCEECGSLDDYPVRPSDVDSVAERC